MGKPDNRGGLASTVRRIIRKLYSDIYNRTGLITHWNIPEFDFPDPGKKKILIMIDSLGRAGAQRVACLLASGLAEKCCVVLLVYKKKAQIYPVDKRVKLIYMPTFYYGNKEKANTKYVSALKKAYRIDTAVSLLHQMNLLNVFSKGEERVIVSERNNPKLAYPDDFPVCQDIYGRADYVIFQTKEVQGMFDESIRDHSCVLPNPVSVTCHAKDIRKKRIVNVARLHKNKNQELLIRAFALFVSDHPDYTLSIYGDGPERMMLKRLAGQLGVEDKVILHGNVPDIHEQIADAGMFVLSSNTEGMPNALLEAMMMGLPCITTNCTGAKEVVENRVNGIVTETGNVNALSMAMSFMADYPEEADRMRMNAMRKAEDFHKEKVLYQWEELILGE